MPAAKNSFFGRICGILSDMKYQNTVTATTLRFVFFEIVGDLLYWPIWWYTRGISRAGLFALAEIKSQARRLGVGVWVKNIFVPMFGQYDIEGRLISFFVRLIQIIIRTVATVLWATIVLLIFGLWVLLPLIAVYFLIYNLSALVP